jgi:hypothetical protein
MDLWLPGYEHQPVYGAGLSAGPGAPKVGAHTTETGPGSLQPLINHWRVNWGSGLPHFIQEGSRIVQLLAINVGAYTAQNRAGGADINRSGPMVQSEVVSRSADGWDDETYETFGRWLADLKRAGHDFDVELHPRFYGANEGIVLARESSPIRFTAAQFDGFNGWLGHQHFPENDHWDPGRIDADRIVRIANRHLGRDPIPNPDGGPEMNADEWTKLQKWEEDTRKIITDHVDAALRTRIGTHMFRDPRDGTVWRFDNPGLFRTYVKTPAQFDWLAVHGVQYHGDLEPDGIDSFEVYPAKLSDEDLANVATFTADEIEARLAEVRKLFGLSEAEQQSLAAGVAA